MSNLVLIINGRQFGGWKGISVKRSMEALCGSFELNVTDRWGVQGEQWQIKEGDECTVVIDGTTLITGYVDSRRIGYQKQGHTFTVTGRDKAADLVDSSAVLKGKWQFVNQNVLQIATALAAPFNVPVLLDSRIPMPPAPKTFPINPGETAFEAIDRICRLSGLLPVSDTKGGIILTQANQALHANDELLEGYNILSADVAYDDSARFNRYITAGQHYGDDNLNGKAAAAVQGEAIDTGIRPGRVLMVRAEGCVTTAQARTRAQWEASVRAGRAAEVNVVVQGWGQTNGEIWPINRMVALRSPLLGINQDMLIAETTFTLDDDSGTTTTLALKRPDAYLPEPVDKKKGKKKKGKDGASGGDPFKGRLE